MEHLDVWRMSASRPWQLEKTHADLMKHLKYSGEIHLHLIESILVEDLSAQCIHFAKYNGYKIHIIKPAQGQGYAVWYALNNVVTSKYSLKWEDDFRPTVDIPLDTCIGLMDQHPKINQICFNKRETMRYKIYRGIRNEEVNWPKEQRYFKFGYQEVPLVVKEKWWFGTALWRTNFIKPIFRYWPHNTHNLFNDHVILPLALRDSKSDLPLNQHGGKVPSPKDIEDKVGCYIYGKTEDPPMVEHTGIGDSIWAGEFQKKMKEQGKVIIGV